jgi:hypothetical protein
VASPFGHGQRYDRLVWVCRDFGLGSHSSGSNPYHPSGFDLGCLDCPDSVGHGWPYRFVRIGRDLRVDSRSSSPSSHHPSGFDLGYLDCGRGGPRSNDSSGFDLRYLDCSVWRVQQHSFSFWVCRDFGLGSHSLNGRRWRGLSFRVCRFVRLGSLVY